MQIIISPAKKMKEDIDSFACRDLPALLPRTRVLLRHLRGLDVPSLRKLLSCNDQIAELNYARFQTMDLERDLTPALLAYEGIQYRYMAPAVFTSDALEYVQEHLRILSGFYGVLRPFDGVRPYRLEMQAKLSVDGYGDLYGFWGGRLGEALGAETDTVVDLASKEYSRAVLPHLPRGTRVVTCVFGEVREGRVVEKGTLCKMARGEMVRYMAQRRVKRLEELTAFSALGYRFDPGRSGPDLFIFLREGKKEAAK